MARQILIDDGLDYEQRCIHQLCEGCGWSTREGLRELSSCPACGVPIETPMSAQIGLTVIQVGGRNVDLSVADGGPFSDQFCIQAAELADTLKFIARNFRHDWFRGLPVLAEIQLMIQAARAAVECGRAREARAVLGELLDQLDPRGERDGESDIRSKGIVRMAPSRTTEARRGRGREHRE